MNNKKVPDYLRDQEQYLLGLAKDKLFEYYLGLGYSEEDAKVLAGRF